MRGKVEKVKVDEKAFLERSLLDHASPSGRVWTRFYSQYSFKRPAGRYSGNTMALPQEHLQLLKSFVQTCQGNPQLLHLPELSFFKSYLESLGAKIPPPAKPAHTPQGGDEAPKPSAKPPEPEEEEEEEEEEIVESDVDIDNSGVIEDDDEESPEYGDESVEVTDEMIDAANDKRNEAMDCMSNGDLETAIKNFTEAIKLNPMSTPIYAKRASCYLRIQKPRKAIQDCNKAIALNPDSAAAYKWRGKANKMLGNWEDAYHDLTLACKLDYDDDANALLKEVTGNAKKIMEHKRKYERLREERELRARQQRVKKAREDYERQKQQQSQHSGAGGMPNFPGGFPGAFPGAGGAPGMPNLSSLLSDPDILAAFQDPEVAQAFQDISNNPANISKYQNNPKVQKIINKLASKYSADGGGTGEPDFPDVE